MSINSRAETIRRARWSDIARRLAMNAKRGVTLRRFFGEFKVDDFVFTYIGNGNPYSNEPSLREAEHQLFRAWCKQEVVTILAEASDATDSIHVTILDLSDGEADSKWFAEVFSKYVGLAASPQAFKLAMQIDNAAHEGVIG